MPDHVFAGPTGTRVLFTEHSAHRPSAAIVASSQFALATDPSSAAIPTFHIQPTLQGVAVASPPAREGGGVGSITNQTTFRRQLRVGRSPRYSSRRRVTQHVTFVGSANTPSPAILTFPRFDERRCGRRICRISTTVRHNFVRGLCRPSAASNGT